MMRSRWASDQLIVAAGLLERDIREKHHEDHHRDDRDIVRHGEDSEELLKPARSTDRILDTRLRLAMIDVTMPSGQCHLPCSAVCEPLIDASTARLQHARRAGKVRARPIMPKSFAHTPPAAHRGNLHPRMGAGRRRCCQRRGPCARDRRGDRRHDGQADAVTLISRVRARGKSALPASRCKSKVLRSRWSELVHLVANHNNFFDIFAVTAFMRGQAPFVAERSCSKSR